MGKTWTSVVGRLELIPGLPHISYINCEKDLLSLSIIIYKMGVRTTWAQACEQMR